MQIPSWLKATWWAILVAGLTYFLRARLPDLLAGRAAAADVAVFGVWMALLLAPLFTEVSLLGITLKNEIDELKGHIAAQLSEVRADVRSAVDVRTNFNPTFHFPSPVGDAQIPAVEAQVKAAVAAALAERGVVFKPSFDKPEIPVDAQFLFETRFQIERELNRIAENREIVVTMGKRRHQPAHMLARALVQGGLLGERLGNAVREVYAVCSAGIHGEEVSEKQVSFVRDVGAELVAALQAIE